MKLKVKKFKRVSNPSSTPTPLMKANNRKIEKLFPRPNVTNKATVSSPKMNKIMQTQSRAGIDLPRPQSRMEYLRQRLGQ